MGQGEESKKESVMAKKKKSIKKMAANRMTYTKPLKGKADPDGVFKGKK